MSSAYPEGFFNWWEDERNAFFAEEAKAYHRQRDASTRGQHNRAQRPVSPIDDSPRFRLTAFKDIKPDDGARYLAKGFLPTAGLAVIWGEPKCGKSFWTLDALMHVALDWAYRGHRVKPGLVAYCILEGQKGFRRRIEAFRQKKLTEGAEASPPFYDMETPLSLVADADALVNDIRRQLGDQRPAVVSIDTLNRPIAGSESSDEDMSRDIRAADAIRAAFDCLVVIVGRRRRNQRQARRREQHRY